MMSGAGKHAHYLHASNILSQGATTPEHEVHVPLLRWHCGTILGPKERLMGAQQLIGKLCSNEQEGVQRGLRLAAGWSGGRRRCRRGSWLPGRPGAAGPCWAGRTWAPCRPPAACRAPAAPAQTPAAAPTTHPVNKLAPRAGSAFGLGCSGHAEPRKTPRQTSCLCACQILHAGRRARRAGHARKGRGRNSTGAHGVGRRVGPAVGPQEGLLGRAGGENARGGAQGRAAGGAPRRRGPGRAAAAAGAAASRPARSRRRPRRAARSPAAAAGRRPCCGGAASAAARRSRRAPGSGWDTVAAAAAGAPEN